MGTSPQNQKMEASTMKDADIAVLTRAALRMADPAGGNHPEGGLAILSDAARYAAPNSPTAMGIKGLAGVVLLQHGRFAEAASALRCAAEEAGMLKQFVLRRWLLRWYIQARNNRTTAPAA